MISILIIDDDLMNCDLLTTVFTRHGYRVISATSAREGLELFRRYAPRVTLVDLRMPEMDGLTALKEIRAIDPHAPVIILGGGATELQENQARTLRVTDFIRKGLSLDVLVEAVHRVSQLPVKSQTELRNPEGGVVATAAGESILVADDDPLVRDLLMQFLSLRGYRVTGAKDGAEVLQLVEQSAPDLILLDLLMPETAGIDVLQHLREHEYHGGIIVMTGSHNQEILEDAWALGPQEVLSKPIDLERLLTAIQLVLVCREC
jgi:CheY-like chemotaxis protein